jgi:hypothetical protein
MLLCSECCLLCNAWHLLPVHLLLLTNCPLRMLILLLLLLPFVSYDLPVPLCCISATQQCEGLDAGQKGLASCGHLSATHSPLPLLPFISP